MELQHHDSLGFARVTSAGDRVSTQPGGPHFVRRLEYFHYQRALEKLFQIATAEEPSPRSRIRAVVVVGGAILVAVVLLFGVILWLR